VDDDLFQDITPGVAGSVFGAILGGIYYLRKWLRNEKVDKSLTNATVSINEGVQHLITAITDQSKILSAKVAHLEAEIDELRTKLHNSELEYEKLNNEYIASKNYAEREVRHLRKEMATLSKATWDKVSKQMTFK